MANGTPYGTANETPVENILSPLTDMVSRQRLTFCLRNVPPNESPNGTLLRTQMTQPGIFAGLLSTGFITPEPANVCNFKDVPSKHLGLCIVSRRELCLNSSFPRFLRFPTFLRLTLVTMAGRDEVGRFLYPNGLSLHSIIPSYTATEHL